MRIHANNLTVADIHNAAEHLGIRVSEHGSRKRNRAFEVALYGSSFRRTQDGSGQAATWDEWGDFLAALFDADDSVTVPRIYESPDHFHWATGARYMGEYESHSNHKWEYEGECVTGSYSVHKCKCGAIRRTAKSPDHLTEILAS